MKVGDYVRTKNGSIFKIIGGNEDNWDLDISFGYLETFEENWLELYRYNDNHSFFNDRNVIKSSSNIIDLIEVGDYVNGGRVVEHAHEPGRLFVENIYVGGKGQTTIENYSYELTSKYCYDEPDFIKSIVTKEQFESMEYKMEE